MRVIAHLTSKATFSHKPIIVIQEPDSGRWSSFRKGLSNQARVVMTRSAIGARRQMKLWEEAAIVVLDFKGQASNQGLAVARKIYGQHNALIFGITDDPDTAAKIKESLDDAAVTPTELLFLRKKLQELEAAMETVPHKEWGKLMKAICNLTPQGQKRIVGLEVMAEAGRRLKIGVTR